MEKNLNKKKMVKNNIRQIEKYIDNSQTIVQTERKKKQSLQYNIDNSLI